jgi:hypothetical protein
LTWSGEEEQDSAGPAGLLGKVHKKQLKVLVVLLYARSIWGNIIKVGVPKQGHGSWLKNPQRRALGDGAGHHYRGDIVAVPPWCMSQIIEGQITSLVAIGRIE